MASIGDNRPPSTIEFSADTQDVLAKWLEEHPVVTSEEEARAGKLLFDRAKNSLEEMEQERDGLVRPLNTQVAEINERYRQPRADLGAVQKLLLWRLDDYREKEERRRAQEAEEKRRLAEEAEAAARNAEALERERMSEASSGVETDVASATVEADRAYSRFEKASREAARAEKATAVKVGGGFGRALGARTRETLEIVDWQSAIEEMGLTEGIKDAILTSARAFRREFKELPAGITSKQERRL